jgi:hypothetical protein
MADENKEQREQSSGGIVGVLKEGKRWYLTALLVFLLVVLGVVVYLVKYRPMEFFYVLF